MAISENSNSRLACIVCAHVARHGKPVLQAQRDEAVDSADSGWQFLCGLNEHLEEGAEIWGLSELLEKDPSLVPFVGHPIGTMLFRTTAKERWSIL